MTDPIRWLDEGALSEEERQLLSEGSTAQGSTISRLPSGERRRIKTTVAGIAAGTVVTSLLSAKIAVAALIVGGSAATWVAVDTFIVDADRQEDAVERVAESGGAPGPTPAVVHDETPTPAGPEEMPAPDEFADDLVELAVPTPGDARASVEQRPFEPTATESERTEPPEDSPPDALAAEVAALEQAQGLLSADPAGALRAAQQVGTEFPNGQLAAERQLIIVQAYLGLGQTERAHERAQALIEQNPRGIYARRARALVE